MTVVLPTGEITHLGATVSKTSSGYSLLNLMIGSEGTLGIITELTLKIIPAPKVVASLIIPFEDLDTALSTVPKFKMAHMDPQAIEFMEREIVLSSERYIGKSVFPQELEGTQIGAYLLVTLDGKSEDEVDALIEEAAELVLEAGAMDVLVADTPGKIKDAWAARSSFLEAIMEETKLLDECDVVVPVNKIAEYLAFVNKTGEECGLEITALNSLRWLMPATVICTFISAPMIWKKKSSKREWINSLTLFIKKQPIAAAWYPESTVLVPAR